MCLYFSSKRLQKILLINPSPFNMMSWRKLKTCITLLTFKMNNLHSCLWEVVAIRQCPNFINKNFNCRSAYHWCFPVLLPFQLSFLLVDSYVTLNFKACVDLRFHLFSRQHRKQHCIDKLNNCFHSPFLPFSCVPFYYTLSLKSDYITILFKIFIMYLVFKFWYRCI